jgi:hypothetical protein
MSEAPTDPARRQLRQICLLADLYRCLRGARARSLRTHTCCAGKYGAWSVAPGRVMLRGERLAAVSALYAGLELPFNARTERLGWHATLLHGMGASHVQYVSALDYGMTTVAALLVSSTVAQQCAAPPTPPGPPRLRLEPAHERD